MSASKQLFTHSCHFAVVIWAVQKDWRGEYSTLSLRFGDSQLRCAGVQGVTPGLLRSLGGEIPTPVADVIKQGFDRNVKRGLEGKVSMGGLLVVLTALLAFIFVQN